MSANDINVLRHSRSDVLRPGRAQSPPISTSTTNEYKASVDIRTCEIIEGNLPRKQQKLTLAWAELHQEELMADWNLVMNGENPFRIQPLH